eukprot:3589963-Rhodomonas_salina.2
MCSEGFGCPELKKLCPPDCLQSKEQNQPKSPPSGTQITAVCTTCGIDDILQVPIRLPEVRHVMQLLLCKQSDCSGSRTQDQAEGRGDPYIQEGYLPIRIAGTKPSIFVRKLSYRQGLVFWAALYCRAQYNVSESGAFRRGLRRVVLVCTAGPRRGKQKTKAMNYSYSY